ncbi:MAG: beta-hydroxyacyl-ACP dehydratase [Prevotellaceae bacterium]|jgi:3-hydroxyacyl-[acyl-carrier-protein] dehydratase|nr:beta-hydroxyacyl-ACP dehydratase [Prevotellaceae bacterium]
MLLNQFFTIEAFSKDAAAFRAVVRINEGHPVFAGHFPGQPVVPGVFTLQMIKECMAYAWEKEVRFAAIQNCKFSRTILPGERRLLEIHCTFAPQPGEWPVTVSVQSGDIIYLSLKARMALLNS